MIRNLLQILVKNPISLILFLQNSAQLLKATVFSLHQLIPLDQYLANIYFTKDDIKRIVSKLDSNNAHGRDLISTCMLKMFGDAIIEPLFALLKKCLKCDIFLHDWKKANIVPIFRKGEHTKHQKLSPSLSSFKMKQSFQIR